MVPVTIPPLRQRREDIAALAQHFTAQLHEEGDIPASDVDDEALALLSAYDWPGNVRQLQNAIFRAGVLCDSEVLGLKDFPEIARQSGAALTASAPVSAAERQGVTKLPEQSVPVEPHPAIGPDGHVRTLAELEEVHIRLALKHYRGRMSEVARRLGIGRSTLYRKLGEYALDEEDAA